VVIRHSIPLRKAHKPQTHQYATISGSRHYHIYSCRLRNGCPQLSNCTAAMVGIFSRSFCVTATLTVITPAAGPVIRTYASKPGTKACASFDCPGHDPFDWDTMTTRLPQP